MLFDFNHKADGWQTIFKWGQVLLFACLKNFIYTHYNFIARIKATQISSVFRVRFCHARLPIYKKSGVASV